MLTSLLLTAAMTVSGAHTHDRVGSAIANAGDVNGDGVPDMIVGEQSSGTARAGAAYVVFGRRGGRRGDLGRLRERGVPVERGRGAGPRGVRGRRGLGRRGERGFRIDGPGRAAHAGFAVAGAGDVNGDGLDDMIVGAAGGGVVRFPAGEAYVGWGQHNPRAA